MLANIQCGVASAEIGPASARQIQNYYQKEEAIFDNDIIMIAINREWKKDISQEEMFDATRYPWKLSKKNIKS